MSFTQLRKLRDVYALGGDAISYIWDMLTFEMPMRPLIGHLI